MVVFSSICICAFTACFGVAWTSILCCGFIPACSSVASILKDGVWYGITMSMSLVVFTSPLAMLPWIIGFSPALLSICIIFIAFLLSFSSSFQCSLLYITSLMSPFLTGLIFLIPNSFI